MSTERLQYTNPRDLYCLRSKDKEKKTVDINILRKKLRDQTARVRINNYIFLSVVCLVVAISGFIASI